MAVRPNSRNWNDVQTVIATVSIVTTLGLWNLFVTPAKIKVVQTSEPVVPPKEPLFETEAPAVAAPTGMLQVKIMFTPGVTPTVAAQQVQSGQPVQTKKKRNKSSNNTTSTSSVTQTKTS